MYINGDIVIYAGTANKAANHPTAISLKKSERISR